MPDRPRTQRELKKQRKAKEQVEFVTVTNTSKQAVPIQLKAPKNVDFFTGEQTTYLRIGKSQKYPKHRVYPDQLRNLQAKRYIRVNPPV